MVARIGIVVDHQHRRSAGPRSRCSDFAAFRRLRLHLSARRRRQPDVKVDPSPGALSAAIVPPIISTRRLLIARPRPVPPYRRVVDDRPG